MNRSSPVPAVLMQPQTMMLPPPCLTFSWYSWAGRRHTCWTPSEPNKALKLIRPQDMVPLIHALGQVVISKLFAGFFESQLQKRLLLKPYKQTCCSVWCMVWALTSWPFTSATSKAVLAALWSRAAPDAQHKDLTSLIDPSEACSNWNPFWKTSVWPWPLYCNSVPGCYNFL